MIKRSLMTDFALGLLFTGSAWAGVNVAAEGYVLNWLGMPVEGYEVSVGYWWQTNLLATKTTTTDATGHYRVVHFVEHSSFISHVTWVSADGQGYFAADWYSYDQWWFPAKRLGKDPGRDIGINKSFGATDVTLDGIKALYR